MPEARTITFSETDLQERASYDDFEPGEYGGILVDVKDVTAASSGNTGERWVFQVDGLNFSITTWNQGKGGWKLAEVLRGLGVAIEPGKPVRYNPTALLGRPATVKIGYENRPGQDNNFLTVLRVLPSSAAEATAESLFDFADFEEGETTDAYV